MFHPYKKDSSYLRAALFSSYKEKCVYCGRKIQQRDMHVDHIVPSNIGICDNDEVKQYLIELENTGFILDSIENYLPSCPACNVSKSNNIFSAANLRFYHEKARAHVDEILHIIDKQKNAIGEFFYSPIDTSVWEKIDFSYQRSISHAIMGYRLTSADVEACPRFPQVEKIVKQLMLVDYLIVQGETGCGKSISVYQAAYDLYRQNWKIYLYKPAENQSVPLIPNNSEYSLYIIDDAQRLSDKVVDAITAQARPNIKILMAKTISSTWHHDTILLTNRDAVKILYNDFLARKQEITPIVHQCDSHVGINFLDLPIERRLKGAKDAATPWQFNYTLRGGWQTMKEQYQTIYAHRNCGFLAAAIASFQIMQLDNNVNYCRLCDSLQHLDATLKWDDADLRYLVEQRIVLSMDEVRIVHLESAAVIVAQFLQYASAERKKLLSSLIELSFLDKVVTPLGLVWLCNTVGRHSCFERIEEILVNEKMISSALEQLQNVETPQERANIAFFMEKVFTMPCEKDGYWYFINNEELFLIWFTHANSETAYAYSRLINTVYNTDKKFHQQFTRKIDWIQMIQCMLQEEQPDLYAWSNLLNRTTFSLHKREYRPIAEIFQRAIESITSTVTVSTISDFSDFLCSVIHLVPTHVHETIRTMLPLYQEYFKNNMSQAMYLFDFNFLLYICGMNLLGEYKARKDQRKTAAALVAVLPAIDLASAISNSLPRDWKQIHIIMSLVELYDLTKAKEIVSSIDLAKLTDIARNHWNQPEELRHICRALQIGDNEIARQFVENNGSSIQHLYPFFVMIAPQLAIKKFNEGLPVEFASEYRWAVHYYALYKLIKTDRSAAKTILSSILLSVIDKLSTVSYIDFQDDGCLNFLQLVAECYADIYQGIISALDFEMILDNLKKSHMPSMNKKQISARCHCFLNLS